MASGKLESFEYGKDWVHAWVALRGGQGSVDSMVLTSGLVEDLDDSRQVAEARKVLMRYVSEAQSYDLITTYTDYTDTMYMTLTPLGWEYWRHITNDNGI